MDFIQIKRTRTPSVEETPMWMKRINGIITDLKDRLVCIYQGVSNIVSLEIRLRESRRHVEPVRCKSWSYSEKTQQEKERKKKEVLLTELEKKKIFLGERLSS